MKKLALALVLVVTAAGSCPIGMYNADRYCETLAELQCKYWYQCCNAAERVEVEGFQFVNHRTEAECREEYTKSYCWLMAPYQDAVAAGRATWDEAKATSCTEAKAVGASSCDAEQYMADGEDTCDDGFLVGQVADGGECYISDECADEGAECIERTADSSGKPLVTSKGTCEAPPVAGEACKSGTCAPEHYCDIDDTCRRKKANNSVCDYASECQSGRCVFDVSGYLCAGKLANGESCSSGVDCVSAYCNPETARCSIEDDAVVYAICDGNERRFFGMTLPSGMSAMFNSGGDK